MRDPIARFWTHVRKTNTCWLWTAGKFRRGYGSFKFNGKTVKAHRFSYELHVGPIPPKLYVCHHCDNTSCVRPDHLFVGTQFDNMRDMAKKKNYLDRSGEHNANAKLTKDTISEIRQEAKSDTTQKRLAQKFGISRSQIGRIVRGQAWCLP